MQGIVKDALKFVQTLTMRYIGNQGDSKHDIYVGNRCYSAKLTLTHFITEAILEEITKPPSIGMLARAIERCTKNCTNFDNAIYRESSRQ